jgi:hypothetical protein
VNAVMNFRVLAPRISLVSWHKNIKLYYYSVVRIRITHGDIVQSEHRPCDWMVLITLIATVSHVLYG